MKELRLQIHDEDVQPTMRLLLDGAIEDAPNIDGFGKSWNTVRMSLLTVSSCVF